MKTIRCHIPSAKVDKKNPPLTLEVADSFFSRFCGLMLRKKLPAQHGLLLAPCNSIHMCFMRFAIDAVYLDKTLRIQKVVRHLRPWLGLSLCLSAWAVVELPAGEADRLGLQKGQSLSVEPGPMA